MNRSNLSRRELLATAIGSLALAGSRVVFDRYALVLVPGTVLMSSFGWERLREGRWTSARSCHDHPRGISGGRTAASSAGGRAVCVPEQTARRFSSRRCRGALARQSRVTFRRPRGEIARFGGRIGLDRLRRDLVALRLPAPTAQHRQRAGRQGDGCEERQQGRSSDHRRGQCEVAEGSMGRFKDRSASRPPQDFEAPISPPLLSGPSGAPRGEGGLRLSSIHAIPCIGSLPVSAPRPQLPFHSNR